MLNYQRVIAGSSLLALSPHKYHLIAFDSWKASKCHFPHLGSWNIIEHQSNAKKNAEICRNSNSNPETVVNLYALYVILRHSSGVASKLHAPKTLALSKNLLRSLLSHRA
jgi:hypothetical protein